MHTTFLDFVENLIDENGMYSVESENYFANWRERER